MLRFSPPRPNPITPSPISSTITWWVTFEHAEEGAEQGPLGLKKTVWFQRRNDGSGGSGPGKPCRSLAPIVSYKQQQQGNGFGKEECAWSGRRRAFVSHKRQTGPGQIWPITENESQSSCDNMSKSCVLLQLASNHRSFSTLANRTDFFCSHRFKPKYSF